MDEIGRPAPAPHRPGESEGVSLSRNITAKAYIIHRAVIRRAAASPQIIRFAAPAYALTVARQTQQLVVLNGFFIRGGVVQPGCAAISIAAVSSSPSIPQLHTATSCQTDAQPRPLVGITPPLASFFDSRVFCCAIPPADFSSVVVQVHSRNCFSLPSDRHCGPAFYKCVRAIT